MNQQVLAIRLEEPMPAYRQITEHLRKMILTGELPPGSKLPSMQQLAAAWKKQAPTIQAALVPLVREGLLVRYPSKGTFVRQREAKLTCVAIYSSTLVAESQFGQALQFALKDELQRRGIEPDIWVDPRPDSQAGEPWMPLVRAAEHREFQALIMENAGLLQVPWLQKLPVPTAALGGLPGAAGRVFLDHPQIAAIGLQALAAQGCRSAGFILPANPTEGAAAGARNEWGDLCERFRDLAAQSGVTVRNEWMRLRRQEVDWRSARFYEQFGYEEFLKLWRQPARPEGLVVPDDVTARGVILGLREKQVRVPAELKLVLHKNEAVDLFCPMPATFMVLSEREIARALVEQVQKQFRGEQCAPISIPFRLRAHSVNNQPGTNNQPDGGKEEL